MRYYEITGLNEAVLTEEMIREGFLDSIRQTLGNKIKDKVSVVTNAATALQVIYKCIENQEYFGIVLQQIRKAISRKLKDINSDTLRKVVQKILPTGDTVKSFLSALCVVGALNAILAAGSFAADAVKDVAGDTAKDIVGKLAGLPQLIGGAANASGIFNVFHALEIADKVIFKLLTYINQKILNAQNIKMA